MAPAELVVDRPFGKPFSPIADRLSTIVSGMKHPCTPGVDAIDFAIDELKWSADASKRILVIRSDERRFDQGRGSVESALNRAARLGVVVHVLEFGLPHGFAWG